jgi:hypothetical protein
VTRYPVAITTDESVACGAAIWRFRGRLTLTVVVKATFSIGGAEAKLVTPVDVACEDRTASGAPLLPGREGPAESLDVANDLAPYLARCGVTLRGHAHAAGQAVTSTAVRLAVFRDRAALLDKTLHVFGDRAAGRAPQPFTRMPLGYERAFGGPQVEANPVGVPIPNVVDPRDPARPAGFGPISPLWAARKRFAGALAGAPCEGPVTELPDAVPWDYFQAAPEDQRIDYLRGGEWIVMDGMHPSLARLQVQIGTSHGAVRVLAGGARDTAAHVDLVADTLAIDADQLTCSILWRGRHEVVAGPAALADLRVVAGLEQRDKPVDWTRLFTADGAGPAGGRSRTVFLRPEDDAAAANKSVSPFPIAPAGAGRGPSVIPGAPWSDVSAPAPPPAPDGEETLTIPGGAVPSALEIPPPATVVVDPPGPPNVAEYDFGYRETRAEPEPQAKPASDAVAETLQSEVALAIPREAAPPVPAPCADAAADPARAASAAAAPDDLAAKLRDAGASESAVAALLRVLKPAPRGDEA